MRKTGVVLLVIIAGVLLGLFLSVRNSGRKSYQNDGRITISHPKVVNNEIVLIPEEKEIPTKGDPVSLTLQALLADGDEHNDDRAIPKGTKLNKVTVTDGLATVDFSKEFKALENSGEAKGSIAMKAILSSLEQFPTIKLVSITVDGVTFADSAVGKWENLPVRTDAPPNEAPK